MRAIAVRENPAPIVVEISYTERTGNDLCGNNPCGETSLSESSDVLSENRIGDELKIAPAHAYTLNQARPASPTDKI